jgi:transcriptional regulator with XRE-family HTH domain
MWDVSVDVTVSGECYRERREALGLSKAEVGRRMDAASGPYLSEPACRRCVSELERGGRRYVEFQKLEALHAVLGMDAPTLPPGLHVYDDGQRLPDVVADVLIDPTFHAAAEHFKREVVDDYRRSRWPRRLLRRPGGKGGG